MPRKKRGANLEERVSRYLKEYELDDLNQANDMAALRRMCQLEINMEQIQEALSTVRDPAENSKKVRDLHASLKDANASWVGLQTELGISRSKRVSENDETPVSYIERLKEQSKKFLESRLSVLKCPHCGQPLGKYYYYTPLKGEPGSIESKTKPVEPYPFVMGIECWKCHKFAKADQHGVTAT